MYQFKIDRPGLAPGTELQIHGLGIVKNGEEVLVDNDQAETFRAFNSTVKSSTDSDGNVTVVQELGPTLLQAFKNDKDVTVKAVKREDSKPDKAPETEGAATDEPVQSNERGEG